MCRPNESQLFLVYIPAGSLFSSIQEVTAEKLLEHGKGKYEGECVSRSKSPFTVSVFNYDHEYMQTLRNYWGFFGFYIQNMWDLTTVIPANKEWK